MTDRDLLRECRLQLEYLNEKFKETGTTNALLTKIDAQLKIESDSDRFMHVLELIITAPNPYNQSEAYSFVETAKRLAGDALSGI